MGSRRGGAGSLEFVTPGGEGGLEGLVSFSKRMWDSGSTPEAVASWMDRAAAINPNRPGDLPPTLLLVRDGEVIGYVSTIPMRLWMGEADLPMYFVKGLTVLPEYRNGPAAFLLLREVTCRLPHAMCMTAGGMLRGLFTRAGYIELGALRNHVRLLEPGEVLARLHNSTQDLPLGQGWSRVVELLNEPIVRSLFNVGSKVALSGWSLNARGRGVPRIVESSSVDLGELEELWIRSRVSLAAAPARDSAYLAHRYLADATYVVIELRRSGRLDGVAFLRRPRNDPDPRLRGIRVATLSDVVVSPGRGVLPALLRGAEYVSRDLGAHSLLFTASHRLASRASIRRGYLPLPGNVYAFFRDGSDRSIAPPPVDQWWLTRGDSRADEGF